MLIIIFILLVVSIIFNGLLIFLLYRSYRLYQNEEVEKYMLKSMLDRKCSNIDNKK